MLFASPVRRCQSVFPTLNDCLGWGQENTNQKARASLGRQKFMQAFVKHNENMKIRQPFSLTFCCCLLSLNNTCSHCSVHTTCLKISSLYKDVCCASGPSNKPAQDTPKGKHRSRSGKSCFFSLSSLNSFRVS